MRCTGILNKGRDGGFVSGVEKDWPASFSVPKGCVDEVPQRKLWKPGRRKKGRKEGRKEGEGRRGGKEKKERTSSVETREI